MSGLLVCFASPVNWPCKAAKVAGGTRPQRLCGLAAPKQGGPIEQTGNVMPTNAKVSGDVHALVREVVCHRQAFDAPGDGAGPANGIADEVHASQVWLTAKAATSGTRTRMRLTFLRFLIDRPSAV